MGKKINDTGEFPNTTPAADDFVLGVDVSNTANDANGEVVTFTVEALRNASAYATAAQGALAATAVQPGANVSVLTNDAGYTTATGTVVTSGTPVANDFARFTDANTIEGRNYAEVRSDLGLVIGTNVQAYSGNLTTFLGANALPAGNGTDGQVLTSDGAGAAAWEDGGGGGGGLVPISKTTASASSAVDIDLTGGYSAYLVRLEAIIPASDAASLYLRTSTDGGSTVAAGASDYGWSYAFMHSSLGQADDNSDSQIVLASPVGNESGNGEVAQGFVWVFLPGVARNPGFIYDITYQTNVSVPARASGAGNRLNTTAIDAVRFLMSSGNITSGNFHLYGIADGA
jgi:hypothetical protein